MSLSFDVLADIQRSYLVFLPEIATRRNQV